MNEREIKALVKSTVAECREFFRKEGWCSSVWNVDVTVSFSAKRARSFGGIRRGRPFISLAMGRYVGTTDGSFYEYRSFQHDRDIGTILNNTVKSVKALVVHEMAHALQYSGSQETIAACVGASKFDSNGHGKLWKGIYRAARKAIVNDETVQIMPKPVRVFKLRARNTMKRAEALQWIREAKNRGWTNKEIICHLVTIHFFKKTTATTYTYSVETPFRPYEYNN